MLLFGQERSRGIAALAAEPCCAPDSNSRRDTQDFRLSKKVSDSYNHAEGVATAFIEHCYIDVNSEGWEALKAIPEHTHLLRTASPTKTGP